MWCILLVLVVCFGLRNFWLYWWVSVGFFLGFWWVDFLIIEVEVLVIWMGFVEGLGFLFLDVCDVLIRCMDFSDVLLFLFWNWGVLLYVLFFIFKFLFVNGFIEFDMVLMSFFLVL